MKDKQKEIGGCSGRKTNTEGKIDGQTEIENERDGKQAKINRRLNWLTDRQTQIDRQIYTKKLQTQADAYICERAELSIKKDQFSLFLISQT